MPIDRGMFDDRGIDGVHYVHVIFAFLMFACTFAALLLRYAAMHRSSPRDIAVIMALVRPVVPVLVTSLLIAVGFGFWLAVENEIPLGSTWLIVAYVFVGYVLLVGAVAGRYDRKTREVDS